MATFHGVGINWGVESTIIGVNGLFQTRDHNFSAEKDLIRDGGETTVSAVYWDAREIASFTYISYMPGIYLFGDAFVSIPTLGDWITVIDTRYPRIAGQWLVDNISIASSNQSAARITLAISRYPYLLHV